MNAPAKLPPPERWSLAMHYAHGTRKTRREIRHALRHGKGADEASFARWVMERQPWRFFARPDQLPPPGDWSVWLMQGGRGCGKTRAGAEWIWEQATTHPNWTCAVVSPTNDDLKKVSFGGPSGLMQIAERKSWLVAHKTMGPWFIRFTNGSVIQSFTAEAYERLRGPNHHAVLWDEAAGAARVASEVYDQISFGLRLGRHPRLMITSTPKPIPLFKQFADKERSGDTDVVITRATTFDNAAHLAQPFLKRMQEAYGGTRLGRQELEGALLDDVPGALWRAEMLQEASVPARFDRIVVAVDPSGAADEKANSDEIGIVVVGMLKRDGIVRFYVLEDATMIGGPVQWATRAVRAFHDWDADRLVAETNYGGAMVESTIKQVDEDVPVRVVHASRGKVVRAEPVSALYEQSRVYHCGRFPELEDQMLNFTQTGYVGTGSPDRVDALVWAVSDLMGGRMAPTVTPGGDVSHSYWHPEHGH